MPTTSPSSEIRQNILECIGNTPIVRLNKIPVEEGIQCEIGKLKKLVALFS